MGRGKRLYAERQLTPELAARLEELNTMIERHEMHGNFDTVFHEERRRILASGGENPSIEERLGVEDNG